MRRETHWGTEFFDCVLSRPILARAHGHQQTLEKQHRSGLRRTRFGPSVSPPFPRDPGGQDSFVVIPLPVDCGGTAT